jgi:hypothetical protein
MHPQFPRQVLHTIILLYRTVGYLKNVHRTMKNDINVLRMFVCTVMNRIDTCVHRKRMKSRRLVALRLLTPILYEVGLRKHIAELALLW